MTYRSELWLIQITIVFQIFSITSLLWIQLLCQSELHWLCTRRYLFIGGSICLKGVHFWMRRGHFPSFKSFPFTFTAPSSPSSSQILTLQHPTPTRIPNYHPNPPPSHLPINGSTPQPFALKWASCYGNPIQQHIIPLSEFKRGSIGNDVIASRHALKSHLYWTWSVAA